MTIYFLELNAQVQKYLEEHLMKSFSNRWSLLAQPRGRRDVRAIRRKMSVKGAIKKTRSINVDCLYCHVFYCVFFCIINKIHNILAETLGMEGECIGPTIERKSSWLDVESIDRAGRSPSPSSDDSRKRSVNRYFILVIFFFITHR